MQQNKKYILYSTIKPYDLKLSLAFPIDIRIRYIQEYIEDTMKSFRTKYKVGRIEHKKTSSILLPDFKIGEVLEDKDELIVYSIEYGLTKKTLPDNSSIEDIDKLFIGKKIKRESNITSRKESIEKKDNQKTEGGDENDEEEEEENEEKEEEKVKEKEKENNKSNKKKEEKNKKEKTNKKSKKTKEDENSSDSGQDDSQDLKI
jgi:hypothetical protein